MASIGDGVVIDPAEIEPVGDPVPVEYEKGVAVDRDGFFVAAYQWPKGTPRPKLNQKGTPESAKLSWLTMPEATADPVEGGKWDAVNLVWLTPSTPAFEVLQRADRPGFWTLQGKRLVWPEKVPPLQPGRKWVFVAPPETRARRPVWSDAADDWVLPARRMIVDGSGVCAGVQLALDDADVVTPPGGRAIDPDQITVTDELDEVRGLRSGDILNPDNTVAQAAPPRYKRVPVRLLRQVLQDRGLLADFQTFLQGKGFTVDDFEGVQTVSLNNQILREFVLSAGYTLKQAYTALQRAAEDLLEQERAKLDELAKE